MSGPTSFGDEVASVATMLLTMVMKANPDANLAFEYKNWRGETRNRKVSPFRIWYGSTEWHPLPQMLLEGYCHDAMAKRDFAIADIAIDTLRVID